MQESSIRSPSRQPIYFYLQFDGDCDIELGRKARNTSYFRDNVRALEVFELPLTITTMFFTNCQSKEWDKIRNLLLTFPALSAFSVEECYSADELYGKLCISH